MVGGGYIPFVLEIAFMVLVIMGCILLVQGTRRIPVQYAKRVVGSRQYGGGKKLYSIKKLMLRVLCQSFFAQALMLYSGYFRSNQ
jgi:preprotein translocase subunit SecY